MGRIAVAIGVVQRDGRILICRRKKESALGGYWEFPGGKCESGESLHQCVQRELMEEVGIKVEIARELTPIMHDYAHGQVALHSFLCRHVDGEAAALQCDETKWVRPEELSGYRFPPPNETLLAEVLELIAQRS